jgi:oxalate decarboxylase
MDSISRRQMLAVTAAGGLLTTTTIVNAQTGPFQSKPGDGGVGRQASELPPGDKVAYTIPRLWLTYPISAFRSTPVARR